MVARNVDPRDRRWRDEPSAYRIDFWRPLGPPPPEGDSDIGRAYESDEWELTGVRNVEDAIAWANSVAAGREFTLYAVVDRGESRGLVRLCGTDPTVVPRPTPPAVT